MIAPRIAEITSEVLAELDLVFVRQLLADFSDLFLVPDDQAEMPRSVGLDFLDFEHGEKLMFPELEKRVALSLVELLEPENVFVESDRLLDVADLDRDVIDPV